MVQGPNGTVAAGRALTTAPRAVPRAVPQVAAEPVHLDTDRLGNVLADSGYFTDAKQASQAIVKVLYGQELGVPPIQSMLGVHIVKGKPTLSAALMASIVQRSGRYRYRVAKLDNDGCELHFFENGEPCGVSTFTREDAMAAKLFGNDTWNQYFRNMAFARALSNGARWFCADVFGGPMYTPDELGARIDDEGNAVVDARGTVVMDVPSPPRPAAPVGVTAAASATPRSAAPQQQSKAAFRERIGVAPAGEAACGAGDDAEWEPGDFGEPDDVLPDRPDRPIPEPPRKDAVFAGDWQEVEPGVVLPLWRIGGVLCTHWTENGEDRYYSSGLCPVAGHDGRRFALVSEASPRAWSHGSGPNRCLLAKAAPDLIQVPSPGRITTEQMRRLHAHAREQGQTHDDLHRWAVDAYNVRSMAALAEEQAKEMINQFMAGRSAAAPASADGESEE